MNFPNQQLNGGRINNSETLNQGSSTAQALRNTTQVHGGSAIGQNGFIVPQLFALKSENQSKSSIIEEKKSVTRLSIKEETLPNKNSPNQTRSLIDEEQAASELIFNSVIDNNSVNILSKGFSKQQLLSVRFDKGLNILQLACIHESNDIVQMLFEIFKNDTEARKQLVSHKEDRGGNQALHFAATTGNLWIMKTLIKEFGADVNSVTSNGLSVLHCGAQDEKGIISILFFTKEYGLNVNLKDNFNCTSLHFAVLNGEYKCVECLLGLDANTNIQDLDGNTPLHLALSQYMQQQDLYDDYKRIMKELLFNGAERSLKDNNGQTCLNILEASEEQIQEKPQFFSLKFILSKQRKKCLCFLKHRPLEKVEKSATFMWVILIFSIINFALFLFYYIWQSVLPWSQTNNALTTLVAIGTLCFVLATLFFLFASLANPGFVQRKFNLIDILEVANKTNIDYENFCMYCQTIKSDESFHCLFCKTCVEKFDHHCPYINNCLGYKNHKYFIFFLLFIFLYFVLSTLTYLLIIDKIADNHDKLNYPKVGYFALFYTIAINCLQLLPLIYQIKEQIHKLMKTIDSASLGNEQDIMDFAENRFGSHHLSTQNSVIKDSHRSNKSIQNYDDDGQPLLRYNQRFTQMISEQYQPPRKGGLKENFKRLFSFRPASQQLLKEYLFSNSNRFSTFILKRKLVKKRSFDDSEQQNQISKKNNQNLTTTQKSKSQKE